MSKKTTYEEVIASLELARRLSLGLDYTSDVEKKINPNDGLIIKALKEKYQNITDEDAWVKFGARMITTAQKELGVVKDKLSGKIPLMALETNQSLQTWKTELEQILADSNQATIRKLIMLSAGDKKEVIAIAPEVLKENEREELSRLRKENKEFLDKIRNLPPSDKEIISFADALDKLEKVARKPTPPMVDIGTQTDLTAEQISQMEKDIIKYRQDIQTEQEKANTLTNQLTNLQGEIKSLQEQIKDKELNEAEKEISEGIVGVSGWSSLYDRTREYVEKIQKYLDTGIFDNKKTDWKQLRSEYQNIRYKLIQLISADLAKRNLKDKITELEKDKNELQTQLDLATKTKEELSKELQKEKEWWESWIRSGIEEWEISKQDFNEQRQVVFTYYYLKDVSGFHIRKISHQIINTFGKGQYYDKLLPKALIKDIIYEQHKQQMSKTH